MTRRSTVLATLSSTAFLIAAVQAKPRLASQLKEGMRIVYSADQGSPTVWQIGSAHELPNAPEGSDCMRYVVQKGPEPGPADTLRQCVRGDTLFSIDRYGEWVMMRPVGASMRVEVKRTNGSTLIETAAAAVDTVSGTAIPIVVTTYTIRGPNGQAIQQLREHFAVSLGTATRGTFYETDPEARDGWKVQRTFRITNFVMP